MQALAFQLYTECGAEFTDIPDTLPSSADLNSSNFNQIFKIHSIMRVLSPNTAMLHVVLFCVLSTQFPAKAAPAPPPPAAGSPVPPPAAESPVPSPAAGSPVPSPAEASPVPPLTDGVPPSPGAPKPDNGTKPGKPDNGTKPGRPDGTPVSYYAKNQDYPHV